MIGIPAMVIYTSIVSRETVCIVLIMVTLNALKIMAANNMNAYITALNKKVMGNTWSRV